MASFAKSRRSAVFALALLAVAASSLAAPSKPNILLILADDMGFSDPGCYGGEVATPNLDSLAKGGLRFTQFYNTARCWPSRAALLTGYYAQEVRRDTVPEVISGGRGTRPGWAKLLPEMLKPLGYRTYHSGKWHVDGKPLQNGLDRSYDIEDHNRNFNPQNLFEDDQKLPSVKPDSGYYTTTAYADHAIKCLKEHAAKYSDQPFFEYLAFTCPHFPLQAPPEDIAKYRDRFRQGWDVLRQERWQRLTSMGIVDCALSPIERSVGPPYAFPKDVALLGPGEIDRPVPWAELTEAQRDFQATKMAIHAAMVDRMDQEIGRVLAQIKAMGAFENTIVLFLSDNGASAEMMVRGDGHDPSAPPGSAKTFLCLGPASPAWRILPFAGTRRGPTKAASPRRSSWSGPRASRHGASCAIRPATSWISCRRCSSSSAESASTPGRDSRRPRRPAPASPRRWPRTSPFRMPPSGGNTRAIARCGSATGRSWRPARRALGSFTI